MSQLQYRKVLESIPSYIPGKPINEVKRELGLQKVIKLASNENPLGCSPKVREAVLDFLDKVSFYPDGHCLELNTALSEHLGVQPAQLAFGAGSFELISLVAQTFITPGDTAVMPVPSFGWYNTATRLMDGIVEEIPLTKYKIDLAKIKAGIHDKVKIIWTCNPNNPTGTIITKQELESFLREIPPHVVVVLDEAYYDYVTDENYPESIRLIDQYPNVIILRTFSKIYGLASFRIAYAISNAENIRHLNKVRQIFNVNAVAQVAALASLQDADFKRAGQKNNTEGKKYLYQVFDELKLEYIPTEGNFVMVDTGLDSAEVYRKLLEKGVIIRPGEHFQMPAWIRISVGTLEENKLFAKAFKEIINDCVG
jgi:histidinol-phosphate aminotransferase